MAKKPNTNETATAGAGETADKHKSAEEVLAKAAERQAALQAQLDEADAARTDAEAKVAAMQAQLDETGKTLAARDEEIVKLKERLARAQQAGAVSPKADRTGGIRIAARPKDGFRRLGIHHPSEPVEHAPGRFTPSEIARLKAEPNLSVIDI